MGAGNTHLRIAAAQSASVPGDIAANVRTHLRFVASAQAHGVDLLIFPELSLCGYELALLKDSCLLPDDPRLAPLRTQAQDANMTIVVGAGLAGAEGGTHIAAFTFFPDGSSAVYCKQHLHAGEERYCLPGEAASAPASCRGEFYALAICADITRPQHAQAAAASGAGLYLAGVLVSEAGYATDAGYLQDYAARLSLGVLMANHAAPSGGYVSAGRSAFWESGGRQVVAAPGAGDFLVIASRRDGAWHGECVADPL